MPATLSTSAASAYAITESVLSTIAAGLTSIATSAASLISPTPTIATPTKILLSAIGAVPTHLGVTAHTAVARGGWLIVPPTLTQLPTPTSGPWYDGEWRDAVTVLLLIYNAICVLAFLSMFHRRYERYHRPGKWGIFFRKRTIPGRVQPAPVQSARVHPTTHATWYGSGDEQIHIIDALRREGII